MPDATSTVLIVSDDATAREDVCRALVEDGYRIEDAESTDLALRYLESLVPDVVIADLTTPAVNGRSLMNAVAARAEPPPVVVIATDLPAAEGAELPLGAYDYMPKGFSAEQLRVTVRHAIERQALLRENREHFREMSGILDKLKRSQTALVQSEKIGSLGRLVAGIAHEINTPLGVLQSGFNTIERAALRVGEWRNRQSPEAVKPLDALIEIIYTTVVQCQEACARIDAVVTNLRQFAQLDRADFQRSDIHEGIESTIALVQAQLPEGTELVRDFGDIPPIDCSPRHLNQMFMNILLNAAEAVEGCGRPGCITVRTRPGSGHVGIDFEDNGIGIPRANLDKIFDPGFTTKGVKVGTGLGLPVCYQIVEAHQGTIDVTSEEGKGTRVTVRLPVVQRL